MPSTTPVSDVTLEEIRYEQMKFKQEVLETLQLMRHEIKDNQEKMKKEQEKLMNEVKESYNEMIHLRGFMMTERKEVQNEQQKILREVEAIRNDLMRKDFEAKVRIAGNAANHIFHPFL
uniref:Meiosis-specific nuclear structural protein 1 n=1 Tax=Caenorhabditis tropicalis TaxID=1561998 RepID=A0A1I7U598_9PELO